MRGFVLEAVYEGYLLHYGEARAFAGMDADMRLLAGDALYALGLARLAEGGDLEAVAILSDLISASAQAQAEGRTADAEALWESSSDRLRARKQRAVPAAQRPNPLVRYVTMLAISAAERNNP